MRGPGHQLHRSRELPGVPRRPRCLSLLRASGGSEEEFPNPQPSANPGCHPALELTRDCPSPPILPASPRLNPTLQVLCPTRVSTATAEMPLPASHSGRDESQPHGYRLIITVDTRYQPVSGLGPISHPHNDAIATKVILLF